MEFVMALPRGTRQCKKVECYGMKMIFVDVDYNNQYSDEDFAHYEIYKIYIIKFFNATEKQEKWKTIFYFVCRIARRNNKPEPVSLPL